LDRSDGRRLLTAASGLLVALGLCGAAQAEGTAAGAVAAPARDVEFIVPVVALADTNSVKRLIDRFTKARMPYYIEPIATANGTVYRVRVGPFADRSAAAKAIEQLEAMGLEPGAVIDRK
jgi:cell division septation protein DedD